MGQQVKNSIIYNLVKNTCQQSVSYTHLDVYKRQGEYLLANYDKVDLNGDGKISYVMFKGQEGNMEAIARTKYGVEDLSLIHIYNYKKLYNTYF